MSSRWTFLVDVGNSAVKVAVVPSRAFAPEPSVSASGSPDRPLRFLRQDLRDPSWPAALLKQSWELFGLEEPTAPHAAPREGPRHWAPRQWVVASVNGPATRALRERVASEAAGDAWYELTHRDLGMRAELRNPAAVGIDRLLGASAAWRASAAGWPESQSGRAVVSIDAGSAVTIDLVRDGVFLGGAILPGLRLQLTSLTQGTDLLPAVHCEGAERVEIPGRDTVSAMRTGVMLGLSGGIDRLIERYSAGCAFPPQVFLTGGDAATLEPLLRHAVNRRDDLVLAAIADAARVAEKLEGEVC